MNKPIIISIICGLGSHIFVDYCWLIGFILSFALNLGIAGFISITFICLIIGFTFTILNDFYGTEKENGWLSKVTRYLKIRNRNNNRK